MKSASLKTLEYLIIPAIGLMTLLSACILISSTPVVWEYVYDSTMEQKIPAQHIDDAHSISRAFWSSDDYTQVNSKLNLKILSKREIHHYEDVRRIIHFFFFPLSLGIISLVTWKFSLKRRIRWAYSLLLFLLTGGTLTIWGLLHWRHMFRTLHWWIFQDDSWILPHRCYTLYLHPYAVWQTIAITIMGSLLFLLMVMATVELVSNKKRITEPH